MKAKNILIFSFLALASIACKKKIDPDNPFGGEEAKYFISGNTEKIAGSDYLWQKGDAVMVMNRQNTSFEYKLVDGAGKTSGKFGSVKAPDFGGESIYYAIYPSNIVANGGLFWPQKQHYNVESSTISDPRCATGTISGTNLSDGTFYCLGGVLNVNIKMSDKSASVYAGAIGIQTDQLISGQFEAQPVSGSDARVARIQNGNMSFDYIEVYLNTADSLGLLMESGKSYNISIAMPESPDGGYTGIGVSLYDKGNALIGTFTTGDKPVLKRAAGASISIEADVEPILGGEFSVSDSQKVRFASGNLYVNTTVKPVSLAFEAGEVFKLYERKPEHVATFYWTSAFASSYADKYQDDKRDVTDVLFADGQDAFSLYEMDWRILSSAEWDYLLNQRKMDNDAARYLCADDAMYLFPDNYDGKDKSDAVMLPYTELVSTLKQGLYWTSDTYVRTKSDIGAGPVEDKDQATAMMFTPDVSHPGEGATAKCFMLRNKAANIRFVTDMK